MSQAEVGNEGAGLSSGPLRGAGVARAAGRRSCVLAAPTAVPLPTAGNSSLIRALRSPGRVEQHRVMGSVCRGSC